MKIQFLLLVLLISVYRITAQGVAINSGGNPADACAILDLSASDKGILIPRMTSAERTSIPSPAQGLLVFDTQSRSFWFYSNGWNEMSVGGVIGPASGDLSGNYPFPSVVKIQNQDVAAKTPLDKQVLKWDTGQNFWAASNNKRYMISRTLAEYDALLSSYQFIRTHKSHLVNKRQISFVDHDGFVVLKDGSRIEVSRRRKPEVLQAMT